MSGSQNQRQHYSSNYSMEQGLPCSFDKSVNDISLYQQQQSHSISYSIHTLPHPTTPQPNACLIDSVQSYSHPNHTKDTLYNQQNKVLTTRPFKKYKGSASLQVEELSKRYGCHLCKKTFVRPSSLKTHSYSHTGEKPFQCPVEQCGRRFSVISNLKRHGKIHAAVRTSTTQK